MPRDTDNTVNRLTEAARTGDRKAFSELVKMFMGPIVALTYRMTGDRDAAKDLAQEAFVSAWQKLSSFRGEARFQSWLYQIASNRTLNYLKRRKIQPISIDLDNGHAAMTASNQAGPDQLVQAKALQSDIIAFMQSLPTQQRAVFELRFYKELSFDEISQLTGKALGTVKTHYRQAIIKLREYATERGWNS